MSAAPWIDLTAAIIEGSTSLPDALCRGRPELFDPRDLDGPRSEWESVESAEARHAEAVELCRRCPVLAECRAWLDSLSASQRPAGVVAGCVTHEPEKVAHGATQTPKTKGRDDDWYRARRTCCRP